MPDEDNEQASAPNESIFELFGDPPPEPDPQRFGPVPVVRRPTFRPRHRGAGRVAERMPRRVTRRVRGLAGNEAIGRKREPGIAPQVPSNPTMLFAHGVRVVRNQED